MATEFKATVSGAPQIDERPIVSYMRQPNSMVPSPYPAASTRSQSPDDETLMWISAINRKLEQLDNPNKSKEDQDISGKSASNSSVQKKIRSV